MSEPSDWEPLPAEDLAMHPGELGRGAIYERTTVPVPSPATAPPKKEPPSPQPPVEPEDPSAGRMLQALKSKLAEAGPSHSLIAEVQRRELRERRQQRAAKRLAECKPVQSTLKPQDVPLDIVFTTPMPEPDVREDEDWFKRLPDAERKRLKDVWARQQEHVEVDQPVYVRNRNERLLVCLVVFAAVLGAGTHDQWYATVGAGICCGIWWRYLAPDRFTDPVSAFACFFTCHLIAWGVYRGEPPRGMFMDAVLLVALAALAGFHGEIKRSGGFDAK